MVNPLRLARKEKGLKQEELARIISVSKSTYSLIERGLCPVSAKKAELLSGKLYKPVDELFRNKKIIFFA
jgi:transcriptional regulator with XRE-family HTH domain